MSVSVDAVARATDPLHAAGDRGWRLDLDDEIDRAHVDAELERARGDERGQPAGLEVVFDAQALLPCDRPVMRVHQLLTRELVQRCRQPLGEAARVDEDEGGPVRPYQLEQAGMDRRPDRGALHRGDRSAWDICRLTQPGHVLDRDLDHEVERLLSAGVEDLDRPLHSVVVESAEESRDLVERTLRGGESDPLELWGAATAELLEALEREREVRSAL